MDKLADVLPHLIWAGLVFYLAAFRFRTSVERLIDRVRKVGMGGASVDLDHAQQPVPPTTPNLADAPEQQPYAGPGALRPPPVPANFEPVRRRLIEEMLRKLDEVEPSNVGHREARLLSTTADALVRLGHEVLYRTIFGSQISLLLKLREGRRAHNIAEARAIFEAAKASFPSTHEQRSFETWLGFLIESKLVEQANDQLTVSDAGVDFLRYLVEAGLTGQLPG